MLELTDLIRDAGGEQILSCLQCGTCTGVCPWPLVREFSPRKIFRLASLGIEGYEQEELWKCVNCKKCAIRCPSGIDIPDVMRSIRSVMVETGAYPQAYRAPLGNLRAEGNPWSGFRKERTKWAENLEVPQFGPGVEHLYFTCCTQAYDPRYRKVGKALISLLKKAGVSFGILGVEESCCGDQARKVGAEETYQLLKSSNVELFRKHGVKKALVSSPHCLQVLSSDYTKDIPIQTAHHTQILQELIAAKKLIPRKTIEAKVTYHDPCYLGRYAGIYDAPRQVLQAIPGLELVEMERNRKLSLCCGGGGGGLWMDVPPEERFAVMRIREAQETGANIIATACPYCISMLEDAVKPSTSKTKSPFATFPNCSPNRYYRVYPVYA